MGNVRGTPEQYLQMWLSEQISTKQWLSLLKNRPDIKDVYNKHMMEKKDGI